MDMRKLVGRNVKRIRQDRGLTQEELAERSGSAASSRAGGALGISGLEQGRRNPTIVSIYELATALGVSHMELVRPTEVR
jgi:transcriptional regulator with XRE-family HTH domain